MHLSAAILTCCCFVLCIQVERARAGEVEALCSVMRLPAASDEDRMGVGAGSSGRERLGFVAWVLIL